MATTKTIQPTGTTITIPAMTDRPDASVFATDVSRITDAVNVENQAIDSMIPSKHTRGNGTSALISIPNSGRHMLLFSGAGLYRYALILVNVTTAGTADIVEIYKGNSVTFTVANNEVTYTISGSSATNITVSDFSLQGDFATVTIS